MKKKSLLTENADDFRYLYKLQKSGRTNMFGAAAYLERERGLDKAKAKEVLLEWMQGYEEIAKDKSKLPEKLKGLNKDGIIICYCSGGECDMSIDLAYEIAKLGFNAVNIYLGGYKEWESAGLPVQK